MSRMGSRGFTLLEVLLAVTILAVVTAMVGFALSSTISVLEATDRQKYIYRQARVTMERMREDLAATVADPAVGFNGEDNERSGYRADSIRFGSMAGLVFSRDTVARRPAAITYTTVEDERTSGALKLLRSEIFALQESEGGEEAAFLLCDSLRSVTISYLDAEGQKNDTWGWLPEDEEGEERGRTLPVAVFIVLEFWQDEEQEAVISFRSAVWLPSGSIQPETEDEQ